MRRRQTERASIISNASHVVRFIIMYDIIRIKYLRLSTYIYFLGMFLYIFILMHENYIDCVLKATQPEHAKSLSQQPLWQNSSEHNRSNVWLIRTISAIIFIVMHCMYYGYWIISSVWAVKFFVSLENHIVISIHTHVTSRYLTI